MAFPSIIAKASKPIKNAKVIRMLSVEVIVLLVADITSNDEAQYSKLIQQGNSATMFPIVNLKYIVFYSQQHLSKSNADISTS